MGNIFSDELHPEDVETLRKNIHNMKTSAIDRATKMYSRDYFNTEGAYTKKELYDLVDTPTVKDMEKPDGLKKIERWTDRASRKLRDTLSRNHDNARKQENQRYWQSNMPDFENSIHDLYLSFHSQNYTPSQAINILSTASNMGKIPNILQQEPRDLFRPHLTNNDEISNILIRRGVPLTDIYGPPPAPAPAPPPPRPPQPQTVFVPDPHRLHIGPRRGIYKRTKTGRKVYI